MEDNQKNSKSQDQLNPGQIDQSGEEVVIKKNEGISDQGNEWSDEEGYNAQSGEILGEKAEKYIKESADIEDLPGEDEQQKKDNIIKNRNAAVVDDDDGENSDEVIEDEDEKVPGYDLGRNKVQ